MDECQCSFDHLPNDLLPSSALAIYSTGWVGEVNREAGDLLLDMSESEMGLGRTGMGTEAWVTHVDTSLQPDLGVLVGGIRSMQINKLDK